GSPARTRRGRREASLGLLQRQLGDGNVRFDCAQAIRQRKRAGLMSAKRNPTRSITERVAAPLGNAERSFRSASPSARCVQCVATAGGGTVEILAAKSNSTVPTFF